MSKTLPLAQGDTVYHAALGQGKVGLIYESSMGNVPMVDVIFANRSYVTYGLHPDTLSVEPWPAAVRHPTPPVVPENGYYLAFSTDTRFKTRPVLLLHFSNGTFHEVRWHSEKGVYLTYSVPSIRYTVTHYMGTNLPEEYKV